MICEICGKVHPEVWPEDIERMKGRILAARDQDGISEIEDCIHDFFIIANQLILKGRK